MVGNGDEPILLAGLLVTIMDQAQWGGNIDKLNGTVFDHPSGFSATSLVKIRDTGIAIEPGYEIGTVFHENLKPAVVGKPHVEYGYGASGQFERLGLGDFMVLACRDIYKLRGVAVSIEADMDLRDTYHAVSRKHLPRYPAELCYRFNRRFHLGIMIKHLAQAALHSLPISQHLLMKNAYKRRQKMKRTSAVFVIIGMLYVLATPSTVLADPLEDYGKAFEETEVVTYDLFEGISQMLNGEQVNRNTLIQYADKLIDNSKILEKSAADLKRQESSGEAFQMGYYMKRVKEILEKGGEDPKYLTTLSSRYYLHYNNCIMTNPAYLKLMVQDHVDEVKKALEGNDLVEVAHLAEHLHLHSDQMYYSSLVFGKKIWQKFAEQIKTLADQIFLSARAKEIDKVKSLIKEIEEPVAMIQKVINE